MTHIFCHPLMCDASIRITEHEQFNDCHVENIVFFMVWAKNIAPHSDPIVSNPQNGFEVGFVVTCLVCSFTIDGEAQFKD